MLSTDHDSLLLRGRREPGRARFLPNGPESRSRYSSVVAPRTAAARRHRRTCRSLHRLGTRVDRPLRLNWFLRPRTQQTPFQQVEMPPARGRAYHQPRRTSRGAAYRGFRGTGRSQGGPSANACQPSATPLGRPQRQAHRLRPQGRTFSYSRQCGRAMLACLCLPKISSRLTTEVTPPMPGSIANVPLDSIAHVIQVALTPVFLLSGIGALLNVFN